MTEFKGTILELNNKNAVVMTENCDFISIKKQPDMFIGQQINFQKSALAKPHRRYMKFSAIAACFLILVFCSVFYLQLFVPNDVFAYIDVDINPSIEFTINKYSKVIDTKPLNEEAQTLLEELNLTDLPVREAITHVIDTSEKLGFIDEDTNSQVLVSASIDGNNSNEKALDKILSDISTISINVGLESKTPEVLKVSPEVHKTAVENNISMGRYELYEKMKENNPDLTVENAKTAHVSDMLNDAAVKNSMNTKDKNTASIGKTGSNSTKSSSSSSKDSKESKDSSDEHEESSLNWFTNYTDKNNNSSKSSSNNSSNKSNNNKSSYGNSKNNGSSKKNENSTSTSTGSNSSSQNSDTDNNGFKNNHKNNNGNNGSRDNDNNPNGNDDKNDDHKSKKDYDNKITKSYK